MVVIRCIACGYENHFDQPYPYHAGFSNQGFLYNDEGNLTLVWSSFDPAYEAIVGKKHPWTLTAEERTLFEGALRPAPVGGNWRFVNSARCVKCANPISGPITQTIYYLRYPGSIVTDSTPVERWNVAWKNFYLEELLSSRPLCSDVHPFRSRIKTTSSAATRTQPPSLTLNGISWHSGCSRPRVQTWRWPDAAAIRSSFCENMDCAVPASLDLKALLIFPRGMLECH